MSKDSRRRHFNPDRLLAGRPGLSVAEKERLFREIANRSKAAPRRAWAWRPLWLALSAATTVALLLTFYPLVLQRPESPHSVKASWQARGGAVRPQVVLHCGYAPPPADGAAWDHQRVVCRRGGRLLFEVAPGAKHRFFSAVALGPDQQVVWYFPAKGADSVNLDEQLEDGVLKKVTVLGTEHKPGAYDIYAVLSEFPLSKEQVRSIIERRAAGEPVDAAVVRKRLEVR